jgi:predicted membrane metal-binding protein
LKRAQSLHFNNKLINFRPVFFCALFFIAGIIAAALFFTNKIAFFIALVAILCSGVVLYTFDQKLPFFLFLVFALGFGLFIYNTTMVEVDEISGDTTIEGRVYEIYSGREEKKYSVLLKDVSYIGSVVGDSDRNVIVYTDIVVEVGQIVEFTGHLEAFNYDAFNSFSMSHYNSQVNYKLVTDLMAHNIIGDTPLTLHEKLFKKIKDNFSSLMDEEAADIAISLFFGQNQTFENVESESTINTKLATIFSLSGIHFIVIAIGLFCFCRLIKLNRSISLLVPFVVLLIYGFITLFPPALYRVLIAQVIMIIANFRYKKSDPLIVWGATTIISLVIQPLAIFEIGFQIAMLSMLGVVCYASFFKKLYGKSKNPVLQTTAYITSTSLSSSLFAGAPTINTFGSFGVYLTLGAILIIPYIGLTYFLTMGASVIVLILPFMSFLLKACQFLVLGVGGISTIISNMSFAPIDSNSLSIYVAIYVLTMFLMCKYILLRPKYKIRILLSAVVLTVVLMLSMGA